MNTRYIRQPDLQRFFSSSGIRACVTIITINVVLFLVNQFSRGQIAPYVDCDVSSYSTQMPWTYLSYPLLSGIDSFVTFLFACLWMYSIGGSLERMWGTKRFVLFFVAVTLATSLSILLGSKLLPHDPIRFILQGLWLPLAAVTVAWAAVDPYLEMCFYFVLKIQARWVALIAVCIIYFDYFRDQPLLGLFGLIPSVCAYLYVRGRLPNALRSSINESPRRPGPDLRMSGSNRKPDRKTPIDEARESAGRGIFGALKEKREREKLEKLWRDSGFSDKDDTRGGR